MPRPALFFLLSGALGCAAQTTQPKLIFRVEPSYSAEASRAGVQGRVRVGFVVGRDGIPRNVAVLRGAGFGLDRKAVEAVSQWRFDPALKDGQPVETTVNVETVLRLAESDGVFAQLAFSPLAGQVPELLQGRIPQRWSPSAGEKVRAEFDIAPNGVPASLMVFAPAGTRVEAVTAALAEWRFSPVAAPVHAALELSVEDAPAVRAPEPARTPVSLESINPQAPQDLTLSPPALLEPADQAVFRVYPRTTKCTWKPVPGAVSYILQWDYESGGEWNSVANHLGDFGLRVAGNEGSFDFVGAQPGRWRVWPINARGERGVPSEWRIFRYTR